MFCQSWNRLIPNSNLLIIDRERYQKGLPTVPANVVYIDRPNDLKEYFNNQWYNIFLIDSLPVNITQKS